MSNHNGVPIIGGADVTRRLLPPPIVNPVRARIAYPLNVPPTHQGRYARAWEVDLPAIRRTMVPQRLEPDAMVAHWVIEAPWCHQIVHSYSLVVLHLRELPGRRSVDKFRPDATHEIQLFGINPAAPRAQILTQPLDPSMWVTPPAYIGQIAVQSDTRAVAEAQHAVNLILEGRLSPDPRHVWSWAKIFGDDVLKHAHGAPPKPADFDDNN